MAVDYRSILDSSAFTRQQAETLVALLDAAIAQAVSEVAPPELVTGSLVQGGGVSLSGTLADRLVGAGDVTVALAAATDPWTYITLDSDFSVLGSTETDSPMAFTPDAETPYFFEMYAHMRTDNSSSAPRPGVKWPQSGANLKASGRFTTSVNTAGSTRFTPITNADTQDLSLSYPATSTDYLCEIRGLFTVVSGTPGSFKITLAAENPGVNVAFGAGSFLRYRALP